MGPVEHMAPETLRAVLRQPSSAKESPVSWAAGHNQFGGAAEGPCPWLPALQLCKEAQLHAQRCNSCEAPEAFWRNTGAVAGMPRSPTKLSVF